NLAANGPALARRSDHRHATRFEEKLQRVNGRKRLSSFELLSRFSRERGGKNNAKLTHVRTYFDRKTGGAEDTQHPMVRGHDFRFEDLNPVCRRDLCELAQQNAAQSTTLKLVRDREGDFRTFVRDNSVESVTNNPLVFATTRDESKRVVQVRLSMSFRRKSRSVLV